MHSPIKGGKTLYNNPVPLGLAWEGSQAIYANQSQFWLRFSAAAIENLHPEASTEVVKRALNELDREIFGLCYDSAHDQVNGPRDFDLLEEFGDGVIAVHLSDRIK